MENSLKSTNEIQIVSGEGNFGDTEVYTGKRTQRAIKSRLTRERCNGDRWARAVVFLHNNETGKTGINLETSELCNY